MLDSQTPPTPFTLLGQKFASPWYLRVDDNLRITSYNALAAVTLEIRYRMVDCEGIIQATKEVQTPNTDRTAKASILVTPEGWLLGGEVFVSGAAPLIGQTFVVVEIVRGLGASALPLEVVARGYVSAKQPLRFPALTFPDSLDGAGALRSIAGTSPGAGAEISETVPTGARWELVNFRAQLVTSATVANRLPEFVTDDGANEYGRFEISGGLVASNTWFVNFTPGGSRVAAEPGPAFCACAPVRLILGSGHRIRTVTSAIQAGDQYSAVQYVVREWIEGN